MVLGTAATIVLAFALGAAQPSEGWRQTQSDDYTRYELKDPSKGTFRILYEVTATTTGATRYWNPIRKGSVATDERVTSPVSLETIPFRVVSGRVARDNGHREADPETAYIEVVLPRPVPENGETRLLIDKTYQDAPSYFIEKDTGLLVFSRSLGIRRNAVVLPPGYDVVSCSYPSQVATEADGRIRLSFWSVGPDSVSYVVKARKREAGR
jgi:hypothetical protein